MAANRPTSALDTYGVARATGHQNKPTVDIKGVEPDGFGDQGEQNGVINRSSLWCFLPNVPKDDTKVAKVRIWAGNGQVGEVYSVRWGIGIEPDGRIPCRGWGTASMVVDEVPEGVDAKALLDEFFWRLKHIKAPSDLTV